jgi:hypothetical protein
VPIFERRFVRPSHFQVVDALVQAAEAVGTDSSAVAEMRQRWDSFVTDLHHQPEGFHRWDERDGLRTSDGIVAIAWWTDHLRRRHFRIWGDSLDNGSHHYAPGHDESDPGPPFWYLAPDQVFDRCRAGEHQWLAVCACGMAGTPQAIGWMGDRCGCCHYKPAEAPAEAPLHFSTLRESRQSLKQLAFSPDGRWLAGAGMGNQVHLWHVEEKAHYVIPHANRSATLAMTFTPDSQLLGLASSDRLLHFVRVPNGEEVAAYPIPQGVSSVTIAPDNLTLAIAANEMLELWGRPNGELPWLPIYVRESMVRSAVFNGRSNRVAVGFYSELVVLGIIERAGCPHTYRRRWMHSSNVPLAFTADGRRVVLIQKGDSRDAVASWEIDRDRDNSSHSLHSKSTAYAISPGAEWVAGIENNTVIIEHVRHADRCFRLQSGHRPFTALAFSPDNHTLATTDQGGAVKLWPWRRLIEV